jgi:carbamate kinase
MRAVIALGGNAILKRGEPMTAKNQRLNVKRAAEAIAKVIDAGHEVVITHGNGPQVGLMALQDMAYEPTLASPVDCLVAETQGLIGYLLQQELGNATKNKRGVATLLTQIEVDHDDVAFNNPSKPIGPLYTETEAAAMTAKYGWTMMADGPHFRRAIASPRPKRIIEISTIRTIIESGVTLICGGGGGIPVVKYVGGKQLGIEAVIDKDHASGLLAREIKADALLLLTDVDGVYLDWGTAQQRKLTSTTPRELNTHKFAAGSMAPKVQAAIDFASLGKTIVGIGRLEDAVEILSQRAGTIVKI